MMATTVRIPTPLRRVTAGKDAVSVSGVTVAENLSDLETQFPGIKARIIDDAGELHRFVNIYINGEDVRFLQGMQTAVKDGDELSIVPAVAGGAA